MPAKRGGTTVRYKVDPRKPVKLTREQAARLDAMTDDDVTTAALSDPDGQPWTEEQLGKAERVWSGRIKVTRLKLQMGQSAFAEAFGFPLRTLQEWEQGRAEPPEAIRSYLRVIEREPDAVMRALV